MGRGRMEREMGDGEGVERPLREAKGIGEMGMMMKPNMIVN